MTCLHQSQGDELVAVERQVADAHPPLLLDELGHRLQLLLADVDKLAPERKFKIIENKFKLLGSFCPAKYAQSTQNKARRYRAC